MKKLMAFAAAISLACPISFAIPTAASADNSGNAAFCQQVAASVGITQGNCLALLNTGAPNANTLCHNFQFEDPADYNAEFSSFGACVSVVNAALGK